LAPVSYQVELRKPAQVDARSLDCKESSDGTDSVLALVFHRRDFSPTRQIFIDFAANWLCK